MIDTGLKDRVVLVTGANHGIGAATVRAFAAQGARVFVTYYRPEADYSTEELEQARRAGVGGDRLYQAMQQQSVEPLLAEIEAGGGAAAAWETNLADAGNIPRLFDCCEAALGPVQVLVCNHTYCVLETFDPARVSDRESGTYLVTAREIDAHFAVNARAYALLWPNT